LQLSNIVTAFNNARTVILAITTIIGFGSTIWLRISKNRNKHDRINQISDNLTELQKLLEDKINAQNTVIDNMKKDTLEKIEKIQSDQSKENQDNARIEGKIDGLTGRGILLRSNFENEDDVANKDI